jgi:ABC-type antimicrobial peptide transport system permease subunit
MAGFTALALLLAMLGVSAVMAHLVAARTREFGIRMALGATPANIASLVSRHTLWPVLFGLGAGLAAALGLSRLVQSFLYGVTPTDAATYLSAIAAVALATPIAIAGPLRRATAVECTVALREE